MQIVTANRLSDGRVVFLSANNWTTDIDDAERLHDKAMIESALARAIADALQNWVVEPYAIAVVESETGHLIPARLRERIRADGPTTGNSKPRPIIPQAGENSLTAGERREANHRKERSAPLLLNGGA
jgi:hypothetical protein